MRLEQVCQMLLDNVRTGNGLIVHAHQCFFIKADTGQVWKGCVCVCVKLTQRHTGEN